MRRFLFAILRGITPDESSSVASALVDSGFDRIEVTLNSPSPCESIAAIRKEFAKNVMVGAGTVTRVEDVQKVREAGAEFVVSPNTDVRVIRAAKDAGMLSIPGVLTPSECFEAIDAGADGLKIFPSSVLGISGLSAIRAVIPADTRVFAVGGIDHSNIGEWLQAGADGFGLGASLYSAGRDLKDIRRRAQKIVSAYDKARR